MALRTVAVDSEQALAEPDQTGAGKLLDPACRRSRFSAAFGKLKLGLKTLIRFFSMEQNKRAPESGAYEAESGLDLACLYPSVMVGFSLDAGEIAFFGALLRAPEVYTKKASENDHCFSTDRARKELAGNARALKAASVANAFGVKLKGRRSKKW